MRRSHVRCVARIVVGVAILSTAALTGCTDATPVVQLPSPDATPPAGSAPRSVGTDPSRGVGSGGAPSESANPARPGSMAPGSRPLDSPGQTSANPQAANEPGAAGRQLPLPGMPAVPNPKNIYADAGANMLSATVKRYPAYAYVPHNKSGDVWIIDQRTRKVVRTCLVGSELQHVVPSYNLRMLYATSDRGNKILEINPATGTCGRTIPVIDPYNMYFTPDGKYAISVAEENKQLVWYNPKTWRLHDITPVPGCAGVDHADFSVDGRTAVFTCEFAGRVAVVDVLSHKVLRLIDMPVRHTTMGPQDIKLAPDGHAYYIADSDANGLWVLNGAATKVVNFISTGHGAHGLYLSRDSRRLFVTNRMEGSISVLNSTTGTVETKWHIPGGGSPDMGNVSADGSQLWVSGRYDNVVYVLSTRGGKLLAKITVGKGPHGMALMPIPGRYSLGHTGITR